MTADEAFRRAISALRFRHEELGIERDYLAMRHFEAARERCKELFEEQPMPTNSKE